MHLKTLQFPSRLQTMRSVLPRIFEPKMVEKHNNKNSIIGNATQLYTLYPIVRDWAIDECEGCPDCRPHVAVYLAACEIIDVIVSVKRDYLSTTDAKPLLLHNVGRWLDLHKGLYGTQFFVPKFFWMWTISERIDNSAWLFDMFCIERQHRRVRPEADLVRNTRRFERSVLARVLGSQLSCMQEMEIVESNYRLGTSNPNFKKTRSSFAGIVGTSSVACTARGLELHKNDIVIQMPSNRVATILECILADVGGCLYLKVEIMQQVGARAWAQTIKQELWKAGGVYHPYAWRQRRDGCIILIGTLN